MDSDYARRAGVAALTLAACAVALSLLWRVPYIYTVIGAVAWSFVGFIVTVDDDLSGGWSPNPGGRRAVAAQLASIAALLAGLIALAVFFPAGRAAGGP
jgi:hypothetical protein